jgi:AcrR family transcriptional regulator
MNRARTPEAKEQRRRKILVAALDEFFESGFEAARTDDIAARAGVSKGTVYLYFDSKEAIFAALMESIAGPRLATIEQMMATVPSFSDALQGLAVFAPAMIRDSDMPKLLKVLIGDSRNFPALVRDYRVNTIERVLQAVARMLEAAKERGEINVEDPDLAARLIVAPVVMSGIWQAVFADSDATSIDLDALFRMHTDHLRQALGAAEVE